MVKNEKLDEKWNNLSFLGRAVVFLSSTWKNVGMTVMWRVIGVNIMWHKTQKGRERESMLTFEHGFMGGGGGCDLGKGRLPVPNIPGEEWNLPMAWSQKWNAILTSDWGWGPFLYPSLCHSLLRILHLWNKTCFCLGQVQQGESYSQWVGCTIVKEILESLQSIRVWNMCV